MFKEILMLIAAFLIENAICWEPHDLFNCTSNVTSFYDDFGDGNPVDTKRFELKSKGFGWQRKEGFFSINDWINVPGLGNYTNVQKNVPIPGTNLKGLKMVTSTKPCQANPSLCVDPTGTIFSNWSGAQIGYKGCFLYGKTDIVMSSFNKNSFQFAGFLRPNFSTPWQEVDIFFIYGNGKAQQNMFSTTIGVTFDPLKKSSMEGVPQTKSTWTKPKFVDDGALHTYTMIRTPTYIQILMDGVQVQYNANNAIVPTLPMKLGFVTRPLLDKTNPNTEDAVLYIKSVTHDADWTKYSKRLLESEEFLQP